MRRRVGVIVCLLLLLGTFGHFCWTLLAEQGAVAPEASPHQHMHLGNSSAFFEDFFKVYTPRRMCMFYETPVIWLHLVSDSLIALAYYSIPLALLHFVRRRKDLVFGWIFWLFAAFILACGTTHLFGVLDLWLPYYRLDGVIKFLTALLSVFTAVALWPLLPRALAIPSRAELEGEVAERTAELRLSNEQLRQSEELYRSLRDANPIGVIYGDVDGKLHYANAALLDMLDYQLSDLQAGKPRWSELTPPEWKEADRAALEEAQARGTCTPYEKEYIRRGGERVPALLGFSLLGQDKQQFTAFILDLTLQKRAEKERELSLASEREAKAQADIANRVKDEFLATLSHELRTPLHAILGWVQILQSTECDPDELTRGLAIIERNARIQAELVSDVLDISRIMSGKLQINPQPLDLELILRGAVESIGPSARSKAVNLNPQLISGPTFVLGDPLRLQQVFSNLLTNAVKFTPAQGSIEVALTRSEREVEVTVCDTGAGIPADFLPFIFERFRQADGSITRKHGGLGLGLAIVKSIVELHGGSLTVSSPGVGEGSTFQLRLPLAPGQMAAATRLEMPRPTEIQASLVGLRVLAVDDEADGRELLKVLLERVGCLVSLASSAEQAYEMMGRTRPEILLSDIGMPHQDGYQLIRQIRSLAADQGGRTPAIALTAFAREDDRKKALEAGFQLHLSKPVDPGELLRAVSALVILARESIQEESGGA